MHVPIPHVPWLEDWGRTSVEPRAQRDYVRRELVRVAAEGGPVLTQVLTAPLEIQRILALSLLHQQSPLPDHVWYLRLVEGARPPHRDAQGRPLPEADRGKVLLAKTSTLGGLLRDAHTLHDSETGQHSGPALQHAAARGQAIYAYQRIARTARAVPLAAAVAVLDQWGHGIKMCRQYTDEERKLAAEAVRNREPGARPLPEHDTWLVEEVPPGHPSLAEPPSPAASPARPGKAA
jgi:hypothetical protein